MGWLGLPIPEPYGGFGGNAVDTMILMEAFGTGLIAEPYVPSVVLAGTLLAQPGAGDAAHALVAEIVAGTRIATLAYAEPNAGYEPAHVTTVARREGDGLVIDGRKVAVPYAAAADTVLVSTRTSGTSDAPDGITLVAVERDARGLSRRDYPTFDERRASDLTFEGVRRPLSAVVGAVDAGLPELEATLDRGIAALCAEAVGAMGVLQRATVEFLKTRTQFGRPIGSFQVLQHRAVDMLVQLEVGARDRDVCGRGCRRRRTARPAPGGGGGEGANRRSGRFVAEQAIRDCTERWVFDGGTVRRGVRETADDDRARVGRWSLFAPALRCGESMNARSGNRRP